MKYLMFSALMLIIMVLPVSASDDIPLHDLRVSFDLQKRLLTGRSEITVNSGTAPEIRTDGLRVSSVTSPDNPVSFKREGEVIRLSPGKTSRIVIEYEAEYPEVQKRGQEDGIEIGSIVGAEGISLTHSWYPTMDRPAVFRLKANLPEGFEAVSEADAAGVSALAGGVREFRFDFRHPVSDIDLIAGRYIVSHEKMGDVDLFAYFFPEDRELGSTYLEYAKKYLKLYADLIGPFPYRRFSIVENILPTGYSMPTFTLLGRDVVKLPFITETSLGHEVLHQWFGNSVSVDRSGGNWSEGLTTYLSDHLYEEERGRGPEYRKKILTEYKSYITSDNDIALKDFVSRTDRATASVGYGKTAMVFHALDNLLGREIFINALRAFYAQNRFRTASWKDLQKAFESVTAQDLGWFFNQWVENKGALDFEVKNVMVRYEGSIAIISFKIEQEAANRFRLPVVLKTEGQEIIRNFEVGKESSEFEIRTDSIPVELVIDPNYDLFRRLSDDEVAPAISMLLGSRSRIFVVPNGRDKDFENLDGFLKGQGFEKKKEEDLKYEDIKGASLLVPSDAKMLKRLYADVRMPDAEFAVILRDNPYNRNNVIAIFSSKTEADAAQYLRKMTHYGRYGTLLFAQGRNVEKSAGNSDSGIRIGLSDDVTAVEVPRLTTAAEVIDRVSSRDIIYIGELHDHFDHHRMQYQIIRALSAKNRKIAIGMEMFQKPYQKALDDYISGAIDEKSFLKQSEYFRRWGFDYNLYREILLFAREKRIPVIALNIRKEIVSKVSKDGIQALGAEELKELPEQLDLSDSEYRERLRGYFNKHAGSEGRNFDFFFQSQVIWDESMARNLNDFMEKNPDYQVVVLAGGGHMAFGSGIPKRAKRLNGREYAVIMNSDDVERDLADYILYPQSLPFTESPKLMVMLKEENKTVRITGFGTDSIAEKAGLEKDDMILSINGEVIETVEDLKISLFYKKKGDTVTVKIKRKQFLFGDREMEMTVKL